MNNLDELPKNTIGSGLKQKNIQAKICQKQNNPLTCIKKAQENWCCKG